MPQKFRWQIEAMMNRRTPVDPDLVAKFRKELYGAERPPDNFVIPREQLAALLAGLKADQDIIQCLERAALENADRVTQLLDRTGRLMVENDRLRAEAHPYVPEPDI